MLSSLEEAEKMGKESRTVKVRIGIKKIWIRSILASLGGIGLTVSPIMYFGLMLSGGIIMGTLLFVLHFLASYAICMKYLEWAAKK